MQSSDSDHKRESRATMPWLEVHATRDRNGVLVDGRVVLGK